MESPIKPDESDCCNSACNPCILDVYEERLKIHEQRKLNSLKACINCISPCSYTVFKLINVDQQSEDAFLFTFRYLRPLRGEQVKNDLGLQYEPGQHFMMKAKFRNEEFTRPYTPIPLEHDNALQFTILVKLYEYGKMSRYFQRLHIGSETLWRGPYGKFKINYSYKYLLLIAQGTGIAPIFSVIHNMINNEYCYTFLKLFFCCRDYDNIYLRDQLFKLSSSWNFTYEIFLSKSDNCYTKYNETIHKRKLEFRDIYTYLLDKYGTVNVLISGSENFNKCITKNILDCKVNEENIFSF